MIEYGLIRNTSDSESDLIRWIRLIAAFDAAFSNVKHILVQIIEIEIDDSIRIKGAGAYIYYSKFHVNCDCEVRLFSFLYSLNDPSVAAITPRQMHYRSNGIFDITYLLSNCVHSEQIKTFK